MEEHQSERPEEGPWPDPDPEESREAALEFAARQSGIRPRLPFVREGLPERQIAVHFFVKKNGGVRKTGCVERFKHASGCLEYVGQAALSLAEQQVVDDAAQVVAWECAQKNHGGVAIRCVTNGRGHEFQATVVGPPEFQPQDGILCDFVPLIDIWLIEAHCLAGTSKGVFQNVLRGLLSKNAVPHTKTRIGQAVLHSFDEYEEPIGRVLIFGPDACSCQQLADRVWANMLDLISRPH